MPHPLVEQLRFTRNEFVRGLSGVNDPEAQQRFGNMNCISWMIGHLAWQEQRYWLFRAQNQILFPELNERLAYGKPASTPPVEEMWDIWRQVTQASDPWLDALTTEKLLDPLVEGFSNIGTFLHRVTYHYWYHLGEGVAVRQMLGHTGLPDFVGDIDSHAPYQPESGKQASEPINKEQLIGKIREARDKLDGLVAQLDDDRMLQPNVAGDWSMKDVLAHITWHEREMVQVLQARALAGSDLWLLPLGERNQAIYEKNRDLPLETVRSEAMRVFSLLLKELGALDEEDLHDPGRFAEMPREWRPWQLLAENTYQHYYDHLYDVQTWLKRTPSIEK